MLFLVSTMQQFSEVINEVGCSSAPKLFTVKYIVLWSSILQTPLLEKNNHETPFLEKNNHA